MVPADFITKAHPGGNYLLMGFRNGDITDAFDGARHTVDAIRIMEDWRETSPHHEVSTPQQQQHHQQQRQHRVEKKRQWWQKAAVAFGLVSVAAALEMRSSK